MDSKTPIKESPISAQIDKLDVGTDKLHELITDLESKLRPVLTPVPESDKAVGLASEPVESQVTQSINRNTNKVCSANERLRQLLANLEV